jgi:hypothetical protein
LLRCWTEKKCLLSKLLFNLIHEEVWQQLPHNNYLNKKKILISDNKAYKSSILETSNEGQK